jgi:hypothetical protein
MSERRAFRKVFRALTGSVVEKRFIAVGEAVPDGWHETPAAALAAALRSDRHSGAAPEPPATPAPAPAVQPPREPWRQRKGR